MSVSKTDIQNVKDIPIPTYFEDIILDYMSDYYSQRGINFDSAPFVLCPLHDENTPSFRYYYDTNTFYCHGCGEGGDIINLHRKFMLKNLDTDVNFAEAITFLKRKFILNKNVRLHTEDKLKIKTADTIENSNIDLMRFGAKIAAIKQHIILKKSRQIELLSALEKYKALVDCNEISAIKAIEELDKLRKNSKNLEGSSKID